MTKRRWFLAAGMTALVLVASGGISAAQAQGQKIIFSSGIDPATAHAIMAESLGLFKKYGLDVTVKRFSSARAGFRTVVSGESNAGQATDMPVISPMVQGANLKIIGSTRKRLMKYAAVVAAKEIQKPADLEGKKIGTVRGGSSGQMFMDLYLKYHKVSTAQPVWLRPQEQLIAFSKGDVDAVVVWVPWWKKALDVRPGAHVLAYDMDNNLYSSDSLIVIRGDLEKDPKTVTALLRALVEADEYMEKNRKGAEKIFSKELNIEQEKIGAMMDTVKQHLAIDEIMVKHLCQSTRFLNALGKIKGAPDWNVAIADQYMRDVAPNRVTYKKPMRCN